MPGGGDPRILGRLHRHGGAFAERAVEQQGFPGCLPQQVQHAAGGNILLQIVIGQMQSARNFPVAFALALLTQVDQGDVRPANKPLRPFRREGPAAPGDLLLRQALMHVGGHRHIHHFRVGEIQIIHQINILLGRLHLQSRIIGALLGDRADRVAFIVMCWKNKSFVG